MREKSQLEDMRAALQGDLERARERRGATLLDPEPELETRPDAQVSDTPDEAVDVPVPVSDTTEPEPETQPDAQVSDTPDEAADVPVPVSDTTEPEPETQPEVAPEPEPAPEPTPKRRFLWFLRD